MRSSTTIMLLATPMLLAAQQGNTEHPVSHTKELFIPAQPVHTPAGDTRSDATALWSEDFEGGLNGWTVETLDGEVDWTLTSSGNTDGYTPGPLESTTGFPGGHWIMADSDAQGTAGDPENTAITSPPILGLDTIPLMLLRFEQSFRQLNNDQTLVEVSGNGGQDWTIYPINQNITGNQSTPGAPAAQVITVNISSALALGSADIRIRFRWISEQGFTYSWQVDDIDLLPVRPNDLALLDATHASWNLDGPGYQGMPCSIYPLGETEPLKFKGIIGNNGSEIQTDVRLHVQVTGPNDLDTTLLSDPITMVPGAVDSLFITGYEVPDIVGQYDFHISVVQEQEDDKPADNSMDRSIQVDEHLFARDLGVLEASRDNNGHDYELGNRFWIEEYGRVLQGVDVALGPGTEVGAVISAKVYDGYFHYLGQSDLHVVTPYEINPVGGNVFIQLPLFEPLELTGERLYLVCVYVQTSDGQAFTGLSGTSLPQTSMIYRYDDNHWYYVTSTPMVRMRLDDLVAVEPNPSTENLGITAAPMPFDEQTRVTFRTASTDEVSWEVRDASGRRVMHETMGRLSPGEHQVVLSGNGLGAGVYVITVDVGGRRSAMKLVHRARW